MKNIMNSFLYKDGNEYLKGLDIQKTFWELLLISMNNAMVKVSTIHSSVVFKVQDTETLWTIFLQLQKLWLFSGVTLTVTEAQLYYMKHFCGYDLPVLWTSFEFTWCSFLYAIDPWHDCDNRKKWKTYLKQLLQLTSCVCMKNLNV